MTENTSDCITMKPDPITYFCAHCNCISSVYKMSCNENNDTYKYDVVNKYSKKYESIKKKLEMLIDKHNDKWYFFGKKWELDVFDVYSYTEFSIIEVQTGKCIKKESVVRPMPRTGTYKWIECPVCGKKLDI